jgi:hypothetical protein
MLECKGDQIDAKPCSYTCSGLWRIARVHTFSHTRCDTYPFLSVGIPSAFRENDLPNCALEDRTRGSVNWNETQAPHKMT